MAKSMHSMRIEDDLWKIFVLKAQGENKTAAGVIAGLMQSYVEGDGMPALQKQEQSEIMKQFSARAASEGIDPTQALEALMSLYIDGGISFQRTVKAVLK